MLCRWSRLFGLSSSAHGAWTHSCDSKLQHAQLLGGCTGISFLCFACTTFRRRPSALDGAGSWSADTMAADVLALIMVRFSFVWQIETSCAHPSHACQENAYKGCLQRLRSLHCTSRRSFATPSVNHVRHQHAFYNSFSIARCSDFRRSRVELCGLEPLLCGWHQRHCTHDSPAVRPTQLA